MSSIQQRRFICREITGPDEAEVEAGNVAYFVGGFFPDVPGDPTALYGGRGAWGRDPGLIGWRQDATSSNVSGEIASGGFVPLHRRTAPFSTENPESYAPGRYDFAGRGEGYHANNYLGPKYNREQGFRGTHRDSYGNGNYGVGGLGSGRGFVPLHARTASFDREEPESYAPGRYDFAGRGRGYNIARFLGPKYERDEGLRATHYDGYGGQNFGVGSLKSMPTAVGSVPVGSIDPTGTMVDLRWAGGGRGKGFNASRYGGAGTGDFTPGEGQHGTYLDAPWGPRAMGLEDDEPDSRGIVNFSMTGSGRGKFHDSAGPNYGVGGAMAGAATGAMIAGPIGALVGGLIGMVTGSAVGAADPWEEAMSAMLRWGKRNNYAADWFDNRRLIIDGVASHAQREAMKAKAVEIGEKHGLRAFIEEDPSPSHANWLVTFQVWSEKPESESGKLVDLNWVPGAPGQGHNLNRYRGGIGNYKRAEGYKGTYGDSYGPNYGVGSLDEASPEHVAAAADDFRQWAYDNMVPVGARYIADGQGGGAADGYVIEGSSADAADAARKIAKAHGVFYKVAGRESGFNLAPRQSVVYFSDVPHGVEIHAASGEITMAASGALFSKLREKLGMGDDHALLVKKVASLRKKLAAAEAKLAVTPESDESTEGLVAVGRFVPRGSRRRMMAPVQRPIASIRAPIPAMRPPGSPVATTALRPALPAPVLPALRPGQRHTPQQIRQHNAAVRAHRLAMQAKQQGQGSGGDSGGGGAPPGGGGDQSQPQQPQQDTGYADPGYAGESEYVPVPVPGYGPEYVDQYDPALEAPLAYDPGYEQYAQPVPTGPGYEQTFAADGEYLPDPYAYVPQEQGQPIGMGPLGPIYAMGVGRLGVGRISRSGEIVVSSGSTLVGSPRAGALDDYYGSPENGLSDEAATPTFQVSPFGGYADDLKTKHGLIRKSGVNFQFPLG